MHMQVGFLSSQCMYRVTSSTNDLMHLSRKRLAKNTSITSIEKPRQGWHSSQRTVSHITIHFIKVLVSIESSTQYGQYSIFVRHQKTSKPSMVDDAEARQGWQLYKFEQITSPNTPLPMATTQFAYIKPINSNTNKSSIMYDYLLVRLVHLLSVLVFDNPNVHHVR